MRLLGLVDPSYHTQEIYLQYEDGTVKSIGNTTIENFYDTILTFSDTYQVNDICIGGSNQAYVKGMADILETQVISKYSNNKKNIGVFLI